SRSHGRSCLCPQSVFLFTAPPPTETPPLSLHDALPILATILVEGIAGGVLTGVLAERRRRRAIERLSGHIIICGYGRVSRSIARDRKSTRLNSSHRTISYAVFCLKKKKKKTIKITRKRH